MSISKTLEKSWIVKEIRIFSKQLEEWVIALRDRYREDLLFRTESNVIFFQIISLVIFLIPVGVAFNYLYQNIAQTLINSILSNISSAKQLNGQEILGSLTEIRTKGFTLVLLFTTLLTIIFGYIVAHITFTPAKNALTSQKRFISNIAHELRTPLAIVKTNTEVILLNPNLDLETRQTLKSNIEEIDRTTAIIKNLLTLSGSATNIDFSAVDLGSVIDEAVNKLRKLAEEKQHQLSVIKRNEVLVWGNSIALEQIVVNLLKNSIEYTKEGGKIKVYLISDYRGNATLTIEDSGSGITQNDLEYFFNPYKSNPSPKRKSRGGFGLSIVSELAKLHRAKITIKNIVNDGTLVTIIFPPYNRS